MSFSATLGTVEQSNPGVVGIITGYFEQDSSYRVLRSQGTSTWLITLTLSGEGHFVSDSGIHSVRQGSLWLVEPGVRQEYGASSPPGAWNFYWAHFYSRAHWLPYLTNIPEQSAGHRCLQILDEHLLKRISDGMHRCHAARQSPGRLREPRALAALEEVLCLAAEAAGSPSTSDPRILSVLEFINSNLPFATEIERMAEVAGLSVSRFAHLFNQETGTSPREYGERLRMERAAQLLALTAMPVYAVAEAMGFDNPYYFSRRFKAVMGHSPKKHREQT